MIARIGEFAAGLAMLAAIGCSSAPGTGPDPIPPRQFTLQMVDNGSLPAFLWRDPELGGEWYLQDAVLVPYAIGRAVDQRLVNDRTGRGGTGGNTRDTTVASGQFMDIRTLRQLMNDGTDAIVLRRDSTLVEAEVRDTVLVITRARPNRTISAIDTGYFLGNELVLRTRLDYLSRYGIPRRQIILTYRLSQ